MKDDDLSLAFRKLATLTAKKITWATAGRATDPGRYMFRFGRIRIIKHEAVPGCGSFEVRFADAMERWFVENDPEGVAFEYEVLD